MAYDSLIFLPLFYSIFFVVNYLRQEIERKGREDGEREIRDRIDRKILIDKWIDG